MRTPTILSAKRYILALVALSTLHALEAPAAPVSVPVIDLSGIWIATLPADNPSPQFVPRAVQYTLTLERYDSEVASNGASVDLFYHAGLVIDGYTATDPDPNNPFDKVIVEPCRRKFIDKPTENRIAKTTSALIPVELSFDRGYVVSLALGGHPANPDSNLTYSLTLGGGAGASHVESVAKGQSLVVVGTPPARIPIESPVGSAIGLMCQKAEYPASGRNLEFRRIATGGGALATASIEGLVKSAVQTMTETEKEVQRFSVQLLRQPNGGVRSKATGESASDYLSYLVETVGSVPLAKLDVKPTDEGIYPFGAPGKFKFDDVPLFEPIVGGGFSPAHYTILVTNGRTDELVLDDLDNIIPGETTELFFGRGVFANVIPATQMPTIELDALDSVPAKQTLVDRLSALCTTNYASAELPLVAYLEQFRSGGLELTEARNEGLKRAVWAERVAVGGVVLADQLYERALGGLGTVLADVFDDLSDFSSKKLARSRIRFNRVAANGGIAPGFKAGNVPDRLAKRMVADNTLVKNSEFAGLGAASAKALKPLVVLGLVRAGASPAAVEPMADNLTLLMVTVLSTVKSNSLAGATKPLIKKAIEEIVNASKPLFLDGPQGLPASYCGLTRDDLVFSVAQTQAWPSFDTEIYRSDRSNVVDTITRMNAGASAALVQADYLLGAASGLDAGADALAVGGAVVKQAAVAEKAAKAAKYLTNTQAIVTSLIEIYANLPLAVNEGIYDAFGQIPTLSVRDDTGDSAGHSRSIAPGRAVVAPDTIPYFQTLDALRNAIQIDDIGVAIEVAADETPTGLPAVRDTWRTALAGNLLQALAVPTSAIGSNIDQQFGVVYEKSIDTLVYETQMWESLSELVEGVLAGDYSDIDDPAYLVQKNRALSSISILRNQLADMLAPMTLLVNRLNGADAGAALLVSLDSLVSQDTGQDVVTQSPERFAVTASVQNLSDTIVGAVTAQLVVISAEGSVTISGPAEIPVGTGSLAANDTTPGGPDEAEVTWTIDYAGDFTGEVISLTVELLEAGEAPTTFLASAAETFLLLDPSVADADLDFMPDSFETQFGLNTAIDDGAGDLDEDGVSNSAEQRLGTFPDDPDSDDDGLTDGEELKRGADGVITDPLDADTDDDGTDDGADGAPGDASTTTPPVFAGEAVIGVDGSVIALGAGATFAEVDVRNDGTGTLLWSASVDRPDVISLVPGLRTVNLEGSALLSLAPGYQLFPDRTETVTITFADESGQTRDTASVMVIVGAITGGADCGDANNSGTSGVADITATDALSALQAAVGVGTCERCRCDVNASGTITATDALALLQSAIGLGTILICSVCG